MDTVGRLTRSRAKAMGVTPLANVDLGVTPGSIRRRGTKIVESAPVPVQLFRDDCEKDQDICRKDTDTVKPLTEDVVVAQNYNSQQVVSVLTPTATDQEQPTAAHTSNASEISKGAPSTTASPAVASTDPFFAPVASARTAHTASTASPVASLDSPSDLASVAMPARLDESSPSPTPPCTSSSIQCEFQFPQTPAMMTHPSPRPSATHSPMQVVETVSPSTPTFDDLYDKASNDSDPLGSEIAKRCPGAEASASHIVNGVPQVTPRNVIGGDLPSVSEILPSASQGSFASTASMIVTPPSVSTYSKPPAPSLSSDGVALPFSSFSAPSSSSSAPSSSSGKQFCDAPPQSTPATQAEPPCRFVVGSGSGSYGLEPFPQTTARLEESKRDGGVLVASVAAPMACERRIGCADSTREDLANGACDVINEQDEKEENGGKIYEPLAYISASPSCQSPLRLDDQASLSPTLSPAVPMSPYSPYILMETDSPMVTNANLLVSACQLSSGGTNGTCPSSQTAVASRLDFESASSPSEAPEASEALEKGEIATSHNLSQDAASLTTYSVGMDRGAALRMDVVEMGMEMDEDEDEGGEMVTAESDNVKEATAKSFKIQGAVTPVVMHVPVHTPVSAIAGISRFALPNNAYPSAVEGGAGECAGGAVSRTLFGAHPSFEEGGRAYPVHEQQEEQSEGEAQSMYSPMAITPEHPAPHRASAGGRGEGEQAGHVPVCRLMEADSELAVSRGRLAGSEAEAANDNDVRAVAAAASAVPEQKEDPISMAEYKRRIKEALVKKQNKHLEKKQQQQQAGDVEASEEEEESTPAFRTTPLITRRRDLPHAREEVYVDTDLESSNKIHSEAEAALAGAIGDMGLRNAGGASAGGASLAALRGLPPPQGSHTVFGDDGAVLESAHGQPILLRGLPAPTGHHVYFS